MRSMLAALDKLDRSVETRWPWLNPRPDQRILHLRWLLANLVFALALVLVSPWVWTFAALPVIGVSIGSVIRMIRFERAAEQRQ